MKVRSFSYIVCFTLSQHAMFISWAVLRGITDNRIQARSSDAVARHTLDLNVQLSHTDGERRADGDVGWAYGGVFALFGLACHLPAFTVCRVHHKMGHHLALECAPFTPSAIPCTAPSQSPRRVSDGRQTAAPLQCDAAVRHSRDDDLYHNIQTARGRGEQRAS